NSANIGAIVGGVVGGLGFLTAGVTLGWWLLRRRHSSRSSQAPPKQPVARRGKEAPTGQAPSRWGGTSYGSDGVMGDSTKDRDMITPTLTLPASDPYAADRHRSTYDGKNHLLESKPPQQPAMYRPSPPPSSYPEKRSHTQG
ncbi:hypothetical protein FRC00_001931, partial [Tulasnella sp. 408]